VRHFSRPLLFAATLSLSTATSEPAAAQAPFDPHVILRSWFGEPSVERAPEPENTATESERAEINRVFDAWHAAENKRPALVADFLRYDVNPALGGNQPPVPGSIRYVRPSLVSYQESDLRLVYDGTALFEHFPNRKTVYEHRLNDLAFGAPVTAMPFPFLYGPEPEQMRIRYHLRPVTPAGTVDQVWIEAVPRMAWEQVLFKRAEFILQLPDYRLYALNLIRDDQGQRTAYVFEEPRSVDSHSVADIAWEIGQRRLVPPGWEHRVIRGDFWLQLRKP